MERHIPWLHLPLNINPNSTHIFMLQEVQYNLKERMVGIAEYDKY